MAAKLYDGKIRGLTSASATLGTQDVELWDDGTIRFKDTAGNAFTITASGPEAILFRAIFGAGAGKPDHLIGLP